MDKLYKFHWDCGRSGKVEGIFIANEEEINNAIGEEVSFGQILGKFSDIYGTLDKEDIKELEVSENTIKELKEVIGKNIGGYNPLDYISYTCDRCVSTYNKDEVDWYINKNENEIICEYCYYDMENKNKYNKMA